MLFAAFHFDPEAAKDIDELTPERMGMTLLKVQMNTDLLTDDLKKKRSSNESFFLVGQPDVELREVREGASPPPSFSAGSGQALGMCMLDTDDNGRSLYPRQVFFPMAGDNEGWGRAGQKLARRDRC